MKSITALACALLAAGCALDPTTASAPAGEKEYRTGSNIPARTREGVQTASPEDVERARAAAIGNMGRGKGN